MPAAQEIMKQNASNTPPTDTPPSSPTLSPGQDTTLSHFVQRFVEAVEKLTAAKGLPNSDSAPETIEGPTTGEPKPEEAKSRASRLAFKRVDEVWDKRAYKYKIAEPVAPTGEVNELDQYVFVVRARIDKTTQDPTSYVDIKSELLRHILRAILRDVRGISLAEDMPSVEQNLLYHFLPDLESYRSQASGDPKDVTRLKHLDLLIDYIRTTYKSTTERLLPLLAKNEITYDLLWAMFKPNSEIYARCGGTRAARCFKYNQGEERTEANGSKYFHVEARYLDFDGETLGEAIGRIKIEKFRGTMRIDLLSVYPLQFHFEAEELRKNLIQHGRTFVSLRGIHHRLYEGDAFQFDDEGKMHIYHIKSRIMIDAVGFQASNPDYPRRRVHKNKPTAIDLSFWGLPPSDGNSGLVKYVDIDPERLEDDDFLLCSPTVLGFSLNDKRFLEFAVANIRDIEWDSAPFDNVRIPHEKKAIIQALTEAYLDRDSGYAFDDYVHGKGLGLISLLHGPPGVGKTLTAEAIAESLKVPLYVIAAGQLGVESAKVENILSSVFKMASRWKAVLLLDEADVFVAQRTIENTIGNTLVSVFLRQLEYYEGILFLTTNRVQTFDEAMVSRMHYAIRYGPLDTSARKEVWESFLGKAGTKEGNAKYNQKDLEYLAREDLNGREIKNAVSMAQGLASHKNTTVGLLHLKVAINANKDFQNEFNARGNLYT